MQSTLVKEDIGGDDVAVEKAARQGHGSIWWSRPYINLCEAQSN
jgi:hypothetical protein